MPYKRPITDLKFNMALLLPPPAPAVVVSPQFPVVGSAMDFIWGGGFASNTEKTKQDEGCLNIGLLAGPRPEQGMTSSTGCMDLAAMTQVEPMSEGEGLATSTACWNLAAMAKEGVRDEWAMDVDEE